LDPNQPNFRPNDLGTRAEMTKLLVELNGGILNPPPSNGNGNFDDVAYSAWYYGYMEDAGERGWVRGDRNCYGTHPCTARPNDSILRAEAAALIDRTFSFERTGEAPSMNDVPSGTWYEPWVQIAMDHCVIQGDSNRPTVRPLEYVTRAELVTMLHRAYENLDYSNDCRQAGTRSNFTNVTSASARQLNLTFNTDISASGSIDSDIYSVMCNTRIGIDTVQNTGSRSVRLNLDSDLPADTKCHVGVFGLPTSGGGPVFNATMSFTTP
jgi:hypothetical protein